MGTKTALDSAYNQLGQTLTNRCEGQEGEVGDHCLGTTQEWGRVRMRTARWIALPSTSDSFGPVTGQIDAARQLLATAQTAAARLTALASADQAIAETDALLDG